MRRYGVLALLLFAAACSFPEVGFHTGGAAASGGAASGGAPSGGESTTGGAPPGAGGTGGTGSGGMPASGGAGGGAPNCVDDDGDFYLAIGSDPSCLGSPYLGIDCYDDNDKAHPGQTNFYVVDRGDGSFDYDCNSKEDGFYKLECNTSAKSLVVSDGTTGCGATWPRKSVKVAIACVDDGTDTQSCR